MTYFPTDSVIHHERVDHQLNLDHKDDKFIINYYVLFPWSSGRAVGFIITIFLDPGMNPGSNSYFFHIIFFWDVLQLKVPWSRSS